MGIIRWLPHLRKINDQDVTDLERADACNLQAALHLVVRKCVLVGARGNGLAKHQLKKLSVLVVVGGGAGVVEGAEFGHPGFLKVELEYFRGADRVFCNKPC